MSAPTREGYIPVRGWCLQINDDAGDFLTIPGTASFSVSGGEATPTEIQTFAGSINVPGIPSAETVSANIPAWQPGHESFIIMDRIRRANTQRAFRLYRPEPDEALFTPASGAMATIATTGIVTFSGASNDGTNVTNAQAWWPGLAIKIGDNYYFVKTIDAPGSANEGRFTVGPAPGTTVAAGPYTFVEPPLVIPFTGTVTSMPPDLQAGNNAIATTVSITPSGPLPYPSVSTS